MNPHEERVTANPKLRSATPVFLVGDIAATMEWYESKLGFDAEAVPERPPYDFCILRKDDVVLFLQQLAGYQKPDHYHEREGGVWGAYLHTDGVRALYDTLKDLPGITVVQPLRRQPYGQTEFEIRDPNGYVLVFAEPA
jgi:predicted enzyme related to lactoylglutathione lyase